MKKVWVFFLLAIVAVALCLTACDNPFSNIGGGDNRGTIHIENGYDFELPYSSYRQKNFSSAEEVAQLIQEVSDNVVTADMIVNDIVYNKCAAYEITIDSSLAENGDLKNLAESTGEAYLSLYNDWTRFGNDGPRYRTVGDKDYMVLCEFKRDNNKATMTVYLFCFTQGKVAAIYEQVGDQIHDHDGEQGGNGGGSGGQTQGDEQYSFVFGPKLTRKAEVMTINFAEKWSEVKSALQGMDFGTSVNFDALVVERSGAYIVMFDKAAESNTYFNEYLASFRWQKQADENSAVVWQINDDYSYLVMGASSENGCVLVFVCVSMNGQNNGGGGNNGGTVIGGDGNNNQNSGDGKPGEDGKPSDRPPEGNQYWTVEIYKVEKGEVNIVDTKTMAQGDILYRSQYGSAWYYDTQGMSAAPEAIPVDGNLQLYLVATFQPKSLYLYDITANGEATLAGTYQSSEYNTYHGYDFEYVVYRDKECKNPVPLYEELDLTEDLTLYRYDKENPSWVFLTYDLYARGLSLNDTRMRPLRRGQITNLANIGRISGTTYMVEGAEIDWEGCFAFLEDTTIIASYQDKDYRLLTVQNTNGDTIKTIAYPTGVSIDTWVLLNYGYDIEEIIQVPTSNDGIIIASGIKHLACFKFCYVYEGKIVQTQNTYFDAANGGYSVSGDNCFSNVECTVPLPTNEDGEAHFNTSTTVYMKYTIPGYVY